MWPSAMPAYYLIARGAPAVSMVSVGLVALPRMIGEQKTEGSLACMRSLPVQAMGEVTRGTITPNHFPLPPGAFLTLAVWCVLGFVVTYAAMARRA